MHRKHVLRIGLTVAFGAAVFLQNDPARAQVPGTAETMGQKSQGFALSAGVATTPFAIDDDLLGFSTFSGAIGLGYKIDRVVIGATFDFSRFGSTNDVDDGMGNRITVDQTSYSFLVGPDLQVALARSADQRAELIGSVGVLVGTWDSETTTSANPNPPPPTNDPTQIMLRWRLAPGVRYWMHPNIAFSGLVGFSGLHQIRESSDGSSNRSSSVTSIYSQFGLMGVF